jgi:hypothetical protein
MTVGVGKSDVFEAALLDFLFTGTAIANLPTATTGNYYIALYTADPTEEGTNPATNEATYTGYARVPVLRTIAAGSWQRTGNVVSNQAQINFGACTAGSNTITHFALVSSASGAGTIFYMGALSASLAVSNGITPQIAAGQLTISES